MELDAQIFSRFLEDGVPTFRLYSWKTPSITYGFSQEPKGLVDLEACARDGVEVAKRITGGGVLFHDQEVTYSFVCNKLDIGEPQGVFVDYRNICEFLLRFYTSLGLSATYALNQEGFKQRSAPDELCSAAYEKYDLVIGSKKIGGNAQKRNRQAIFQHGSIPISMNWDFMRKYVSSLPKDISASVTTLAEQLIVVPEKCVLEQKLINAFAQTFDVEFINNDIYETSMAK